MLNRYKNIFIVGIKGVAMANLAVILKKMGKQVTGSDVNDDFITDELLKKNDVKWSIGFESENLPPNTELVVYSAAHGGSKNPLVIEAIKRNIKTVNQAPYLGLLMDQFKNKIAVTGCHGKTTTSSLLSYALLKLRANPSYLIGSSSFNEYPGGDYNENDYFVIEADEYAVDPPKDKTIKFHHLNPDYVLCTNIDFDHPDVYKDLDHTKEEFLRFFDKKKLVLCADDIPTVQSFNRLDKKKYVTYGFSDKADLQIVNPTFTEKGSSFELVCHPEFIPGPVPNSIRESDSKKQMLNQVQHDKVSIGQFTISLFGEKNILNTTGVVLMLLQLGFHSEKIKEAIKNFTGPKRRFEYVFRHNDVFLFDDYAHHPHEIEATVSAMRKRFPKKKLIIIFQPHTYSRTSALLKEFAESLSQADQTYILPIFPSARENVSEFSISSADVAKLKPHKINFVSSKQHLISSLLTHISSNTIVFTMGAGDVYKLKNDIINVISNVKAEQSNLQ